MIVGIAVLLFAAVLEGVGIHHLIRTGTCSSTGYSANYGPVPHCPAGTGAWIGFVIGGIFLVLLGGGISGSGARMIIPAIFTAIGAGSISVAFDKSASSSSSTFGVIFGGCFFAAGAIPGLIMIGSALKGAVGVRGTAPAAASFRKGPQSSLATSAPSPVSAFGTTSPVPASGLSATDASAAFGGAPEEPDAILGAYSAAASTRPTVSSPTPAAAGRRPSGDVLDKIAKLADLHKSGALTDEEFQREKAKLLAEL